MARWPFACRASVVSDLRAEVASGRSVVLTGEAGVGKSRVLTELCEQLEADGVTVHRVGATTSLSTVPYGAFASVLPPIGADGGDELGLLQRAIGELQGDREAGRTVVAVDDAHLLDRGSASLTALAARSRTTVVATVRSGTACPDGITALWRDDLATRVDLPPLDRDEVGTLLAVVLGAPVDAHTRHRLWEFTQGNLLFLRELVRAGLIRGSLAEHGDVWIWSGGFEGATHLHDLVDDTVRGAPDDVQRVLDLLAVGEPLGAAIVEELAGAGALEAAERAGLAVAVRTGRRLDVRLVHPIYAQVIHERLGRVRSEAVARALADAIAARGSRRSDDVFRIASLQLEAGAAADPAVLLVAARQARQYADLEHSEALARRALTLGGGAPAAVALGETYYWQGRHDEVIELLTSGALDGAPPKQVMLGTIHIASALFYGKGQLEPAEAWLSRAIDGVGPAYEADLRATHARMLMSAGRAVACIEEAEGVLANPEASTRARLNAYIALLSSLGACGRLSELDDHGAAALELASTAGRSTPVMMAGVAIGLFIGHLFGGRLVEFDPTLVSLHEAAMSRDEDPFRGVWSFLIGRSALVQGRIADAIPALREGAAIMQLRDPGMMLPWCLAALTQALSAADDTRGARTTLDRLEAAHFEVARNIEVEVGLARAWATTVAGQRSEGQVIALAVGDSHQADGRYALAALAYHDALRLGAPVESVAPNLCAVASRTEGPVAAAMAHHVDALVQRDHKAMQAAAYEFERTGMLLHAAEAMAGASVLAAEEGLRASAGDLRVQASALAARCGTALTPLLEPISDRGALSSLTRKEQEVALMAARGMTKREIADSLCVSVRTVGNHINHVYGKLGVATRAELRAVLGVVLPAAG
jgi:DNA-binding CsgD family transcriptional regulator/tetratricopeptide (TPR) repeat protein